ncbi:unnamed protein product [Eruca vesicaria subsp. sativa]|uniref:Uncharacterized protein n=1 Tax=Eruca vesicaria subsp. sativa TaxID=29727 RepID=A0ABC8IW26_ERUVS|nr:unnamed protein product [Eruca vesicaria subsp. sativa]
MLGLILLHTLLVNVTILDLRNNRLSGNIPDFTNAHNIRGIPHGLCALKDIHLLDLANNVLKGSISPCLGNLSFGLEEVYRSDAYDFFIGLSYPESFIPSRMANTNSLGVYFSFLLVLDKFGQNYAAGGQTKIEFATKHRYDAYAGRNLLDLAGLDLSQNKLSGEIPTKLGGLLELHALNLSHNKLSGGIQKSFSGLKSLESLDLSFNRLQGEIPRVLAVLSSLAVFNVSYNNLSGVIPQGRQSNTFDIRSYLGNPLLCGKPTNVSSDGNNFQYPGDNEVESVESTSDIVSFYWSLTVAYVTILLGILASLSFDSSWSRAWFNMVDAFIHKVRNF